MSPHDLKEAAKRQRDADFRRYLTAFERERKTKSALEKLHDAYPAFSLPRMKIDDSYTVLAKERWRVESLRMRIIRHCYFAKNYKPREDPFALWRKRSKEAMRSATGLREAATRLAQFCKDYPCEASQYFGPMHKKLADAGFEHVRPVKHEPFRTSHLYETTFNAIAECLSAPGMGLTIAQRRLGCLQFSTPVTAATDAAISTQTMLMFAIGWELANFDSDGVLHGPMPKVRRRASVISAFVGAVFGSAVVKYENLAGKRQSETLDKFLREHPGTQLRRWPEEEDAAWLPNG